MKQKVKLKGHLKAYLQTTLTLGILLAFVNVGIYFLNTKAGICVSGFLVIYLLVMTTLLYKNKPVIMNEFINFATQYGQIQRRLLRDLELPYVLMDDDGRLFGRMQLLSRWYIKRKGIRKQLIPFLQESQRTSWNLSRRHSSQFLLRNMSTYLR